jgi:transitional endoplasmic reticulum ATPase
MDVGNLPLALVRSGRIELWLEMKLPDPDGRRTILQQYLGKTAGLFDSEDPEAVVAAAEGFTGADLKRVVQDAKGLLAFDRAMSTEPLNSSAYLLRAVEGVALNKTRYAEAEAGARTRVKPSPNLGDLFFSMGGGSVGQGIAFNPE